MVVSLRWDGVCESTNHELSSVFIVVARYVFSPVEWALNPIRKLLVTSVMQILHPWTYLGILVIIVFHWIHSWWDYGCLTSLSTTCITPSRSLKANHQKESFIVSTYVLFPFPVTNVHGTFRKRVSFPNSDGQRRPLRGCIVFSD